MYCQSAVFARMSSRIILHTGLKKFPVALVPEYSKAVQIGMLQLCISISIRFPCHHCVYHQVRMATYVSRTVYISATTVTHFVCFIFSLLRVFCHFFALYPCTSNFLFLINPLFNGYTVKFYMVYVGLLPL